MAYFGTFGYELDLNLLNIDEIEEVKKQVEFMKKYRELIQVEGDFYRILSPFEGNETAWIVVSRDKKEAVAMYYQRLSKVNSSYIRFKLKGLAEDVNYEVSYEITGEKRSFTAYGDELMYAGMPVKREDLDKIGGDFASIIYVLKAV